MNQVVDQLQKIVSLYSEILLCIVAAGLLGWLVGWMMQRASHKRKLAVTVEDWKSRNHTLEQSARADAENLEEQLQTLADETKLLQSENKELSESLKKNDSNTQKGRGEAIELNRQHSETHERLQRIIQRKDSEILDLNNRLKSESNTQSTSNSPSNINPPASVTRLNADIPESDWDSTATLAITSHQRSSGNSSDETVTTFKQPSGTTTQRSGSAKDIADTSTKYDNSMDDTSDLSEFGLEESTVAMDDDAVALAQQSYKGRRGD